MSEVDWDAVGTGYDAKAQELRAAAKAFRDTVVELTEEVGAALGDLFDGLADDAETTGADPRGVAVSRALAPESESDEPLALEARRSSTGTPANPVRAAATAVAAGNPASTADVVIAKVAVAVAATWRRFLG